MTLTDDVLHDIGQVTDEFLEANAPLELTRELADAERGYDAAAWRAFLDLGLVERPDAGERTMTVRGQQAVLEKLGSHLAPFPFRSVCVITAAARAIPGHGPLLERARAAVAGLPAPALALYRAADRLEVGGGPGGWTLRGAARLVPGGAGAEHCLAVATLAGAPALVLAAVTSPGVRTTPAETLDAAQRVGAWMFDGASVEVVVHGVEASELLDELRTLSSALLAAEHAGACRRLLEMTTEYANLRKQFGVPIGSFQAVKHLCADLAMAVESAKTVADAAGDAIDSGSPAATRLAAVAHAHNADAFVRSAGTAIQVHGGIAYTWEHPAHLYYRRAWSERDLYGTVREQRERVLRARGY